MDRKFKVGDRVTSTCGEHAGTVLGHDWGSGEHKIDTGMFGAFLAPDRLNGSEVSPIRTVTRREIVPGAYGDVSIEAIPFGGLEISCRTFGNAHKLRSAARIFNEIADVLDEQAMEAA